MNILAARHNFPTTQFCTGHGVVMPSYGLAFQRPCITDVSGYRPANCSRPKNGRWATAYITRFLNGYGTFAFTFSGPGTAVGLLCVCLCRQLELNIPPSTYTYDLHLWISGLLVHLDVIWVKFDGKGHRSKLRLHDGKFQYGGRQWKVKAKAGKTVPALYLASMQTWTGN